MRNCFFEDNDFSTIVRPVSFIEEKDHEYFIDVRINKIDVVKFMMLGIVPTYLENEDIFTLSITLNNSTKINVNGIRVSYEELADDRLQQIPLSLISIEELVLKRYSKKTNKSQQCYATKAIFHVDTSSKPRKKNASLQSR